MRIAIIGAGPAGLYAAYLLKRSGLQLTVEVFEQNPPDATFGFGVVFSDRALDFLKADDEETYNCLIPHMEAWQDLTVQHRGEVMPIDGVGFTAIGRLELLQLFQTRAREVGVEPIYGKRLERLELLNDFDLVIGADGVNSLVRNELCKVFEASEVYASNRFIWYGTPQPFETLTQTFTQTEFGAITAHHYRYRPDMSTFIIEITGEAWKRTGFAAMGEAETMAYCEKVFQDELKGQPLISNNSNWRNFPKIWCDYWSAPRFVLVGDALRTAHFSIGSGTRMAMEDVIALVGALKEHPRRLFEALEAYEEARRPIVEKLVAAANASMEWYERMDELIQLEPYPFAYSYIQRSGRVAAEKLEALAPKFMVRYRAATANGNAG